jgi:5-methylthioadenosine/S-adenosylhomocysteine deaminase
VGSLAFTLYESSPLLTLLASWTDTQAEGSRSLSGDFKPAIIRQIISKRDPMPKVDLLLTHATVVTMDPEYRIISDGAVAISGQAIAAVGQASELEDRVHASETIDLNGRTVIPGLVNGHTHIPMTLLRGLEDDSRLDVWLLGYMMPVEREFVSPEFVRLGAALGCAEMIRSGITTFNDMYYYEDAVAEVAAEAGMRGVCGQTVLKFPSPDADTYEDSLDAARAFIQRWKGHPLIVPAVAPHAPYTCTAEILQACAALAQEFDVPLHIHLSETKQEVDDWREQYDMPVIPWVKKQGVLEAKVIAAHCVHIDSGEIHTLDHAHAGVSHNPSSNLKLASGFAPVIEMLQAGLNVAIGTDGPSSNNDLDMFEEVRLASFVAKGHSGDPTALPARQAFEMATRMGAEALHLGDITGSIEAGKRADLAIVDLGALHNWPHFQRDPDAVYAQLVYAAKSMDVTDVMVNGRWLMRDRELLTVDIGPLMERASEYAQRIDAFLTEREGSMLSKLIAIGGAQQQESYEVQVKVRIDDPQSLIERLEGGSFQIVRRAHYQEYDTYFSFDDPEQGRLRYREDEFINEQGEMYNVRYRLTMIGPAAEREFPDSVLLSRSRFIAPAEHSLRFYREYFRPKDELAINKDRLRWLIRRDDIEYFVNIDRLTKPPIDGAFLEIKSRTWSRRDAEHKAQQLSSLLDELGLSKEETVGDEYHEIISAHLAT